MEKIARALNLDAIDFRLKNTIRPGEYHPFSTAWNEGRQPRPEIVHTVGLESCVAQGRAAIAWDDKYGNDSWRRDGLPPHKRKGIGIAMVMQGTAIPYLDMGGASIKMNDDGSFNLLVGAPDLGTGSDTVLAQLAVEVLGVPLEHIRVYFGITGEQAKRFRNEWVYSESGYMIASVDPSVVYNRFTGSGREQHEGALVHARMREAEVVLMKMRCAIQQQIEVQRARGIAEGAVAAVAMLDAEQGLEQGTGRKAGFQGRGGVDEVGLVGVAHRRRSIQGRTRGEAAFRQLGRSFRASSTCAAGSSRLAPGRCRR